MKFLVHGFRFYIPFAQLEFLFAIPLAWRR